MVDDLDDFLKQAALRRQQRQQQKGKRPPTSQQSPAQPKRRPEPPRLTPEMPTADVVEYTKPYTPTIGNLSPSLSSTSLPSSIGSNSVDQANAKMDLELKLSFQKDSGSMQSSTIGSSRKKINGETPLLRETPAVAAEQQPTAKVSAASMVQQLRDPQTLRMAIIAHEIMKRPWQ